MRVWTLYLPIMITGLALALFLREYKLTKNRHSSTINERQKAKSSKREAFLLFGLWMSTGVFFMSLVWAILQLIFR